jgi:pimeloyl-ACP methyl ester carboxylesterase
MIDSSAMPTIVPAHSRKRISFRWLRYLLAGFLILLLALVSAGAIYEAIESHRDRQRFHPPGRMVDVGGYRLHLYCTGEGSPTVILEAGGGNPWLSWYKVQPQVAQFTRVCSYDRAGLGWSDPSPKPRTTEVIADELHTLLHNAGITAPFVLVGHSLGGLDARMFASQYPSEAVGMVLVDSSHPDQDDRFPPEAKKLGAATTYIIRVMQITLPIGLPRLLASRSVRPEIRSEFCAVFCRPQFIAGVRAEAAAQAENSAQVRALGTLSNMPLVVLSHDPDKVHFPGNLTEPVNREWDKMQQEQAQLSSNGSHLVVKGSGHDIQIDKPEAVVDAIRTVVRQAKEGNISSVQ